MQLPPTHGTHSTKGCEVWRGIWKWFYVHPTANMDASLEDGLWGTIHYTGTPSISESPTQPWNYSHYKCH